MFNMFKKFRVISYLVFAYIIINLGMNQYKDVKQKIIQNAPKEEKIDAQKDLKDIPNISDIPLQPSAEKDQSLIEAGVQGFVKNALQTKEGQALLKQYISQIPKGCVEGVDPLKFPEEQVVIKDIKPGYGNIAECGQDIEIKYYNLPKHLASKNEQKLKYRLGENVMNSQIEAGVIGMKERGVRKITILPNNPKLQPITYEYELLKSSPSTPISRGKLQVFDKKIGNGNLARCGDIVRIKYSIARIDGKRIFNSEMQEVKIGERQIPFGISKAILYMKHGGARVVLMPPELLKSFEKTNKPFIKEGILPENEVTIFEIEMLN
jgi:FKBP-type peptidyl-prolyl cis-trans isomerase